jgi:5S rRNA maturation endonuclease (ribonuclease M5)
MDAHDKQKLLRRTSEALDGASVILVEGVRDERALRAIGVGAPVLRANQTAERVAERALRHGAGDVVLLFDFDEEGERKMDACRAALEALGGRCDARSRVNLQRLTGVRHIEDLPPAWEELREELARGERSAQHR